jgi:hypothetical protein
MRIESSLVSQSLVDANQVVESTAVTKNASSEPVEADASQFVPSPFGSSGVYSPSSLRAAVDYHAKFLTVAQNNLTAANHAATIPKSIIDGLIGS